VEFRVGCRIKRVAQREIRDTFKNGYSPTDVFLTWRGLANHITGYETEVVNLTGHRFGGIFMPFDHPRTGKSCPRRLRFGLSV
jgi:hypothetical protein